MNLPKFTQEVKDKWIEALESGKYIQTDAILEDKRTETPKHCCLGVLGCIMPELDNDDEKDINSPYKYIRENLGEGTLYDIWSTNDDNFNADNPDYSNIIPLIKSLPVKT